MYSIILLRSYLLILICSFLLMLPMSCKVTFYTFTYPPYADCSNYRISSNSSSAVFGAEIQLLRSSLSFLNWTEGVDYVFECGSTNFRDLFHKFNTSDKSHVGIVGGLAMTFERLGSNYYFSQPTTSSPLPLVYRKVPKGWFFRRGLDYMSWIILACTTFAMGGFMYFFENRKVGYVNMLYHAFRQFFLAPDYPLAYYASRVLYYFSTFLVIIVVITFTAASTNIFDSDRNFGKSVSLETLKRNIVFTNDIFGLYLDQYNVPLLSVDSYDAFEFLNMIEDLQVNYLVVDGPYSDFLVRQRCDLYTAKNDVGLIHYGIMFHDKFPRELQNKISLGISTAKITKDFDQHVLDYYNIKQGFEECTDKIQLDNDRITLYQTRGLWYILLAGMGIAAGFFILELLGLLVKKNLQIYGLQGVRAKMDGKIQRRVATIFAIYAAVSVQSISFLKKLCQQPLENDLNALKASLATSAVSHAQKRVQKNQIDDEELVKSMSKSIQNIRKATRKGSFFIRMIKRGKSIIQQNSSPDNWKIGANTERINYASSDYIRNNSLNVRSSTVVENKYETPDGIKNSSSAEGRLKEPITSRSVTIRSNDKLLRREDTRRSCYLSQSIKDYKLNQNLHIKLSTLTEKDIPQLLHKDSGLSGSSSQRNPKSTLLGSESSQKQKFSIVGRSMLFIEKLFGNKGMKKNKQIKASANALLAQKEAMLQTEFMKKKAEVQSRPNVIPVSPKNSPRHTIVTSTQRQSPLISNPSIFKTRYMKNNTVISGGISPSAEYLQRFASPSSRAGDSFRIDVMTPKRFGYEQEENFSFDFLSENDHRVKEDGFSMDIESYNFSQIIKLSPKTQRMLKNKEASEL